MMAHGQQSHLLYIVYTVSIIWVLLYREYTVSIVWVQRLYQSNWDHTDDLNCVKS